MMFSKVPVANRGDFDTSFIERFLPGEEDED